MWDLMEDYGIMTLQVYVKNQVKKIDRQGDYAL